MRRRWGSHVHRVAAVLLFLNAWSSHASAADEPFVVKDRETRWEISGDGTGRQTVRVRFHLGNEWGVQQLGQILEPYSKGRERLAVETLSVHHADGTVSDLQSGQVRDLPAPVAAAFPIYSDLHILHITAPAMRPGDELELVLQREIVEPDAPGQFWIEHRFHRDGSVERETLEVVVPGGSAVRLRSAEDRQPVMEELGDSRLYRWTHSWSGEVEDQKPLDPRTLLPRPDVELTSFPDWQAVGTWYADLALHRAQPDDRIRRKAEELTHGIEGDRERVAVLYDYVRREIRYLGIQFGLARYQPHTAAEVLQGGYGDCKDKHTLLAALLESLGYTARPVLVGSLRAPTPEVPSPGQFDHLITAVRLGDESLWLDSTEQTSPFGYLAPSLRDKQALLVEPHGKSQWMTLPPQLPYPAFETVQLVGRVAPDGTLEGTVAYTGRSDGEVLLRMALLAMTGGERSESAKRLLEAYGIDAEVTGISVDDPADTSSPLSLNVYIRSDGYFSPFRARQEINLPTVIVYLPGGGADDDSVLLGIPARYTMEVDLTFPAGAHMTAPLPVSLERDFASFESSFEVAGDRLTGHRAVQVLTTEVPAEEKADYDRFRAAVRSDGRQTLGLRLPEDALSDARESEDASRLYEAGRRAYAEEDFETAIALLERASELEPRHDDAWEELGRALVKAGRPEDALAPLRRQIEVAPGHASARNTFGWALEEAGDREAALAAFREQLQHDPSDSYAIGRVGSLLWSPGRYEESLPFLRRAVQNEPENVSLQWRLADSELHSGDEDEALRLIQDIAWSVEDEHELYRALDVLGRHGHGAVLEPLADRLRELDSDSIESWKALAGFEYSQERYEEARAAYAQALELDPDAGWAALGLAYSLYELDRTPAALAAFQSYLAGNPKDSEARYWYAVALARTGEAARSVRELEAVVAAEPDRFEAWAALAGLRMVLGDFMGSSEAVDRAALVAPDDAEAQLQVAALFVSADRRSEAKAILLDLARNDGQSEVPCGPVAWLMFQLEAYTEAAGTAESCLEQDPDDGQAHHILGLGFARRGAYAEARHHLERAAVAHGEGFPDQEVLDYVRDQPSGQLDP